LDKALELNLVQTSVERAVNGRQAVVTWWTDDVVLSEQSRRRQQVQPPDPVSWNQQMQAVRLFDELISNTYRNMSPEFYLTTLWDNLLIKKDWRISLIDHKASFRLTTQLDNPASLVQCDRTLLRNLRALNMKALREKLAHYLDADQLNGLEARRALLVKHFDEAIAARGEASVLYDLPPGR
jgi:hypothetical protein